MDIDSVAVDGVNDGGCHLLGFVGQRGNGLAYGGERRDTRATGVQRANTKGVLVLRLEVLLPHSVGRQFGGERDKIDVFIAVDGHLQFIHLSARVGGPPHRYALVVALNQNWILHA